MNGKRFAFGVDPRRKERYSLRQSRYQALAEHVNMLAFEKSQKGLRLKLLDIGVGDGITMRYLEVQPFAHQIDYFGADMSEKNIYQREHWREIYIGDLTKGYPQIRNNTFDVVICEQVLEHLPVLEVAVKTLERVLKPGGTLIVGVPIFPKGIDWIRASIVPKLDKILKRKKVRGHVQAFSLSSFKNLLCRHSRLDIKKAYGFRIASGGILRPLENYRWWWLFKRRLGELIPGFCIEIQIVAEKPEVRP